MFSQCASEIGRRDLARLLTSDDLSHVQFQDLMDSQMLFLSNASLIQKSLKEEQHAYAGPPEQCVPRLHALLLLAFPFLQVVF